MKIRQMILTAAITAALMLTSCGDVAVGSNVDNGGSPAVSDIFGKSKKKREIKDGKEYKNYNDYDESGVIDGFCYSTEENVTRSFFTIERNCQKMLVDPSDFYFSEYDPDGLCDVQAGKFYTVTYDVQHKTGGEAGVSESTFLKVDNCEEIDVSVLFAGDIEYTGLWNCRQTRSSKYCKIDYLVSGETGHRFICINDGSGYILYTEDGGEKYFEDYREVKIPFESVELPDGIEPIGFNVLCTKGVTDDRIIDAIKQGTVTEDEDIFLLGSFSDKGETSYAGECAGIDYYDIAFVQSDTVPDEGFCKIITNEQFEQGITAEEAGLPIDVFSQADNEWRSAHDYYSRYSEGEDRYPYNRSIVIFGGDFTDQDMVYLDDNARLCIVNKAPSRIKESMPANYAVISVRGEYLELFPQQ